jgi:hypothetical protein
MAEVTTYEKSVRLPTFDGSVETFQIFWMRFKAYAKVYKFAQALKIGGETDLPASDGTTIDQTTEPGKKQAAAKKRNEIALANFTMAFTSEGTISLVYKASTADWPDGLAHLVVVAMLNRYMPQDTVTRVELRQMLNKVSMKQNDDPRVIFEQISTIENRYTTGTQRIEKEDLIAVVLDAANKDYQAVLTCEQRVKGVSVTLLDLETAMNQHYRQIKGTKPSHDNDKEINLGAFAGMCYHCKKPGHRAHECPNKSKGGGGGGKNGGGKGGKSHKKCDNCGKIGHNGADCWEKEENKDKRPKWMKNKTSTEVGATARDTGNHLEFLLCSITFPQNQDLLLDPNVWIADTAATVHTSAHKEGFHTLEQATAADSITMGNGIAEKASLVGKVSGALCNKNGVEVGTATLTDVVHLPTGKYNLFSLTKLTQKGWLLGGNDKGIWLSKGAETIMFDIAIPTPKGVLYAIYIRRNLEIAGATTDAITKVSMQQAHDRLAHPGEDMTREIAKELSWTVTRGNLKPCDACAEGKAKQRNVPKISGHKIATVNQARVFLDIATIRNPDEETTATKPNWRIMVDERTQLKFSNFFQTKNGMVEPTCEQFQRWKDQGKEVKYLRMDNAGENHLLQQRCESKDWKFQITCEYTAAMTPQQNHLAELGFAILANRGRALMARAYVPMKIRYKIWKEAFQTATLLDGLTVMTIEGKTATRYVHWGGSNPKFANHLRTWGEAGTVKTKTKSTPRIADRGAQCMMTGYALDHEGDCYRMWDPKTNGIHETRDVIWLRRMYYARDIGQDIAVPPMVVNGIDDPTPEEAIREGANTDGELPREGVTVDNSAEPAPDDVGDQPLGSDQEPATAPATRSSSGRAVKPPDRLIEEIGAYAAAGATAAANYEIGLTASETKYYDAMKVIGEHPGEFGCVGAALGGGFDNTAELHAMKYKQAMKTKDKASWEIGVKEEHDRMIKHKVWKAVPRDEVPSDNKVLTSTWAMKKKSNGTFRARLNARGYEQIPGKHYDPNTIAAPVTSDTTIRIVLTLLLMAGWYGELLDVKGAFLHGEFEEGEVLYMDVPEGFKQYYPVGMVLLLLKTLYGLKQAAVAFWKQLILAFSSMNYARSKADPCLYFAWTLHGLIIWISWVDDCLVCGKEPGVMKAKGQMMDRFDCDEVGNMEEYVGCKLERNYEDRSMKITQPVMLQSFEDEFELPDGKAPNTPATPGDALVKAKPEDCVDPDELFTYRKGTGKLLHMMRWSRPEILNSVRELSRYMSGASKAHVKAMYRAMKYCIGKAKRGLLLKPDCAWDGNPAFEFVITGRSDSDYAKDTDTRKSVSGTSTFLNGSPINTRSNTQKSVTLSVTEAELVAATQCAQDMLFNMRILESMGLKVRKPMILEIDNKGAVDLTHNWSVGGRTRHVDVRQYFLRDLKEEDVILSQWIAGDENSSDLFTKNLPGPLFEKHLATYCGE